MALDNTHRAYVLAKGEVVLEERSETLKKDPSRVEAAYLGGETAGASGRG
jgi:ABC-type branched-subunit amino acid transport system ATPase component